MMRFLQLKYLLFAVVALHSITACGGRGSRGATVNGADNDGVSEPAVRMRNSLFRPMLTGVDVSEAERMDYVREHYWDEFRFADSLYIAHQDTVAMLRHFALYVSHVVDVADPSPLVNLVERADTTNYSLRYLLYLAEKVLYDPNSPLRNDELYIVALERAMSSPLLDKYEKIPYEHDLKMARKNRLGHRANDFEYTLLDGHRGRLYDIDTEYVVIFFSNPGCPMCGEIQRALASSPVVGKMVAEGRLAVVMLYPDEDVEAWCEHASEVPDEWIYGRDMGCVISRDELYDLKAIPSLYLIDKQQRVMVKDAVNVAFVESVLSMDDSR